MKIPWEFGLAFCGCHSAAGSFQDPAGVRSHPSQRRSGAWGPRGAGAWDENRAAPNSVRSNDSFSGGYRQAYSATSYVPQRSSLSAGGMVVAAMLMGAVTGLFAVTLRNLVISRFLDNPIFSAAASGAMVGLLLGSLAGSSNSSGNFLLKLLGSAVLWALSFSLVGWIAGFVPLSSWASWPATSCAILCAFAIPAAMRRS